MKLPLAAVAAGLFGLLAASARAAEPIRITIFHTNDIHGWIMSRRSPRPSDGGRVVGGAAAFKSLVDGERGPKLVIDAGDWFQGTPEGNVPKGQSLVEVFNAVGYDAVEIGNHEFDFGEANLERLTRGLKMPVLGANVYIAGTRRRPSWLKPFIIKDVAGVKVGIFGLLTTNMRNLAFPANIRGLEFRREVDEARDEVAALKKRGATVIIAVTHVGHEQPGMAEFEGDETIAREVPGIDVILGGHSHTFLRPAEKDPRNGTLIVQSGAYLVAADRVTLDIDPATKRVVSSRGELVDLDVDRLGEDPAVAAVVAKQVAAVSKVYDVVIAKSREQLSRKPDGESPLGDWMTDCERRWAGADLAIQNSGGIRNDLSRGPVTKRDIFSIMPFDNSVEVLTMDGRLVADVLDHGVDKTKGMIQVSGASFRYDRDADPGRRLSGLTIGGRPLDQRRLYKVATIDFLVKGGDGYRPFSRAEKERPTGVLLRDVLQQCAVQQALIEPPSGGRMRPAASIRAPQGGTDGS